MSHAVIAFGRMNPPTTGHEKMIHAVHKEAKRVGGHAEVIASHSQDKKKNPVPQDKKMGYLKKVAPKEAQTGPARRNDKKTMAAHLAYLDQDQQKLYKTISEAILKSYGKEL